MDLNQNNAGGLSRKLIKRILAHMRFTQACGQRLFLSKDRLG
jgi:hypothetical protein